MSHTSVPNTMFAALYEPGHQNLVIERHHPVPKPGKGEVLIKVAASGVCHSDVTLLTGLTLDVRKYILGHEIAGVPVELGEGVDPKAVKKGKLYTIYALNPCVKSLNGTPAALNSIGLGLDGGYAPYVVVKQNQLLEVPAGVPVEVAAIAADAGLTAYNAVHNTAGIKRGTNFRVLLFGIGGLGHLAVQYAKYFGATVYVCDNKPEARDLAIELGAIRAFDLIELDQNTKNGFTVDITIDFVANSQTFNLSLAALAGNAQSFPSMAKAVIVGASSDTLAVSEFNLLGSSIQGALHSLGIISASAHVRLVLPSLYGSHEDGEAVLELFASGAIRPVVAKDSLENVRKVIDELRSSSYIGRKVVIPPESGF
ncbi:alcohol dehydrogenase [Moniliophthora roreri]|nr:alcohol dehydrogenase [Moniliophthora roreri]